MIGWSKRATLITGCKTGTGLDGGWSKQERSREPSRCNSHGSTCWVQVQAKCRLAKDLA